MNDESTYHPQPWAPDRAEVSKMTDRAEIMELISVAADQQIRIEALLQWKTDYTQEKRNGMIGALIRWRIAAKDLKNRHNQLLAEEGRAKGERARAERLAAEASKEG